MSRQAGTVGKARERDQTLLHLNSSALTDGSCVQEEYELVIPRGGPLSSQTGTVGQAGLAPSTLLYFRRSHSRTQNVPALSAALLASAQPAPS